MKLDFFFQPKNLENVAAFEWREAESDEKKKMLSLNLIRPLRRQKFE